MTAKKISQLPDLGAAPAATDELVIVDSGVTKKVSVEDLFTNPSFSGNLLVGKSSSSLSTSGFELFATGVQWMTAANTRPLLVNRTGSDGDITEFRKDGTIVGSIGTVSSNDLYIADGRNAGIRLDGGNNNVLPVTSAGSPLDATLDLGVSGARFKNLYLSGGVYLGGTGAANLLDDYEEGTALTTITCSTGGTVTLNANFDTLGYTKVGRLVTCHGVLVVFSVSAPLGYFKIALPFALAGGAERSEDVVGAITVDSTNGASVNAFVCGVYTGSSELVVQLGDATTLQNDSAAELKAGSTIYFSVTYPAA